MTTVLKTTKTIDKTCYTTDPALCIHKQLGDPYPVMYNFAMTTARKCTSCGTEFITAQRCEACHG
jgi:hypothetical protein